MFLFDYDFYFEAFWNYIAFCWSMLADHPHLFSLVVCGVGLLLYELFCKNRIYDEHAPFAAYLACCVSVISVPGMTLLLCWSILYFIFFCIPSMWGWFWSALSALGSSLLIFSCYVCLFWFLRKLLPGILTTGTKANAVIN